MVSANNNKKENEAELVSRKEGFTPARVELPEGHEIGDYAVVHPVDCENGINSIYVVSNKKKEHFALKVERRSDSQQILVIELFILQKMEKAGGNGKRFPKIIDKGQTSEFNWVVMTLAGKSLRVLRKESRDQRLSLGCGISVAIQCLKSLEILHEFGFLHRDVQPSSFAVGRAEVQEQRTVYCLDFGFAHQYKDRDGKIKPKRPKGAFTFHGSKRYASRRCYEGEELSRADDLEMWFYMAIELCKGSLPWMNQKTAQEVYEWQVGCRKDYGMRELLGGLPIEFITVMNIIDKISYEDDPDYNKIYGHLHNAICMNGLSEFPYDWEGQPEGAAPAADAGKSGASGRKKEAAKPAPAKG